MGKGLSKRHRAQRVAKANEGNLAKAMRGKVSGRAFEPLPDAPKEASLKMDSSFIPRSLQKILKVTVDGLGVKSHATKPARVELHSKITKASSKDRKGKNKSHGRDSVEKPADSQHPETASAGRQEAATAAPTPVRESMNKADVRGLEASSNNSLFGVKKLKQSKKDYLNRKKLKKKNKGSNIKESVLERELKSQGKVNFGERSDAPPDVSLKRRNWTSAEKSQGERCKDLFLKQMNEAKSREEKERAGVRVGKEVVKEQQKASMSETERDDLRTRAIEAYRASKSKGGKTVGAASLASLKALVAT